MYILSVLIAGLVLINPAIGSPARHRLCAVENLLVQFLPPAASTSILAFCSSFISIPPQSTTVYGELDSTTLTTTTITTTTTPAVLTVSATTTVFSSSSGDAVQRRGGNGKPAVATPTYFAKYLNADISKACSCLSSKIPIATTTATSTRTQNFSITTTFQVTSTLPALTTTTQTTTVTNTLVPPATVTVTDSDDGLNYTYTRYYIGAEFTENITNPGNNDNDKQPIYTTLNGTLSATDAAIQCAMDAANAPGFYYSFDLHFLYSAGQWECVQFYNMNTDPSYFNVLNNDVSEGYGYDIGMGDD